MSTQPIEYNPIQISDLVDGIHRIMDEANRMSKEEYEDMKEGYITFENKEVDAGFLMIEEVVKKRVTQLILLGK
tara:strand:- start:458 stop:679 length:222 start_codon:yes stop_codon:yes gene_type:complete